ncbi:MAG: hypothetical protein ACFFKA_13835 [Candidatus Thorarchaeota archaeon]
MIISRETTDLLNNIDIHSISGIKNKVDVSLIIELKFNSDRQYFDDIIFDAKYIKGLTTILMDKERTEVNAKLSEEYKKSIIEFRAKLIELAEKVLDTELKFIKDYFGTDIDSLNNLIDLIGDLAECKKYFNYLKYDSH